MDGACAGIFKYASLVLRFEAKTEEGLARVKEIFKEKLERFDSVSKDWDASGN